MFVLEPERRDMQCGIGRMRREVAPLDVDRAVEVGDDDPDVSFNYPNPGIENYRIPGICFSLANP